MSEKYEHAPCGPAPPAKDGRNSCGHPAAERATGTINCADRFDFNWHIMYHYKDDVAPLLPAGTILHIVGVHDNPAANPRNPDPTVWVGWGQRSVDEMMAAHMGFEFMTDKDYKEAVAERKRKLSKSQ